MQVFGSAQWSRRLLVPSPNSPKSNAKEAKPAKSPIKKEHHHHHHDDDDDDGDSQEQEHFLLLDLPSRTLSLLTSSSSSSSSLREGGREGGFYSLVLEPKTLQACQEEIIEYNCMADFASDFAKALQGKTTVNRNVPVMKVGGGGGGGGGGAGATAPAVLELIFNDGEDRMSISLPCLQGGVSPALLPALRSFLHFDAATGIGEKPAAAEGGREGGIKPAAAASTGGVAAAGQKRPKSEGGGRGGVVRSLVHPGLEIQQKLTGSKWEDEDEGKEEGRKRKRGDGAEESKKNGKEGVKRG